MASIAEGRAMLIKNIAAMHRLFALALLLVATAASGPVFAAEAPTATIAEGRIGGAWEDGQRVFRGIPYADRKSVVWGKSVSVRVDLGGRRIIKKKKKKKNERIN